jgi:nitrite reductase/ring-hydroxylating ferredoxin subunit
MTLRFPLPDIKTGQIVRLETSEPVALVKAGKQFFAFRDECTHEACTFSQDGEVIDTTLICNCHGAEFDLYSGAVLQGPAETPLGMFTVHVSSGELEVSL